MDDPTQYSIGMVSARTGLSVHVIRAWERRYGAVVPARSATGRRIYSQGDIDHLVLLKRLTDRGMRISHIAGLDREALIRLADVPVDPHSRVQPGHELSSGAKIDKAQEIIDACLGALVLLDTRALRMQLEHALLDINRQSILSLVIKPFMAAVGMGWVEGKLRIIHGQVAATAVHTLLSSLLIHDPFDTPGKPLVVTLTPAGQNCHLGAMAIAIIAREHGWRSIYLGSNLPGEEIAAACHLLNPQLIALSITCRVSNTFMQNEIKRLSMKKSDQRLFLIGGRASGIYQHMFEAEGGRHCPTTQDFIRMLK